MSNGGARNRSGRRPDPGSARAERMGGRKVLRIPAEPYVGPVPEFPLEQPSRRELDLWAWAWSCPQGWAWSRPENGFRHVTVAMYVRALHRAELPDASPPMLTAYIRLSDQVGMTTAGLHELGWIVGELGEITVTAPAPTPPRGSSRSKIRVLPHAGAA